ncbi:hypothetical protein KSD_00160 [Ktedonobacter sp. SOSP1-85]|nr:hypothetical protein KSD_00160 [Ktedonobacter sp. SOSP1-85]
MERQGWARRKQVERMRGFDEVEPLLSWHGVVQPRLSKDESAPVSGLLSPDGDGDGPADRA